jgi:hypothetical protein
MRDEPPSIGRPAVARLHAGLDVPLTPRLLPAAYRVLLVVLPLAGAVALVAAFLSALWLGLLALVLVPAFVLGLVVAARIGCEVILATLGMAADLRGIAERMPRLESTMDDVVSEMPRLGFLRLLSGSGR